MAVPPGGFHGTARLATGRKGGQSYRYIRDGEGGDLVCSRALARWSALADNGPDAQAVRFRAEYPALHNLLRILRRHGTTPVAVLRDALGDEAISRGRVKASASFADVLTALVVAIDRGLVPGRGIYSGYRALRETATFLPSREHFTGGPRGTA